ncbi:MAG: branched-chain amino acid ABC transporter permease [Candidatus Hermodarchaeota archaeon]
MFTKRVQEKVSDFPSYFKTWAKTFSGGLTLFCVLSLALLPFLSQNVNFTYLFLRQFTLAMIFSIFAASWDLLTGIAGQISFGHAIFFGISSYVCAYLIKYQSFNVFLAMLCGAIAAVLFGLTIGIPCLRLRGPYLALGTLALSLILLKLFLMGSLADIFFGSEGIFGLKGLYPALSRNPVLEYFIIFISMVIVFIIIIQITKSRFGTILKSIRDDELGADASGINTTRYKIYAFMLSALFAGIAGSFYTMYIGAVNPTGNFGTVISFFAILMASLGGIATISGSALGAFFFIFLEYALIQAGVEIYVHLIFAITLIIVVRFAEHGILRPLVERLKDLWDVLLGR